MENITFSSVGVATRSLKFPHALNYAPYVYDSVHSEWVLNPDSETLGLITKVKTPLNKQILALEVSSLAEIDVDALAVLFNLEKAQIQTQVIEMEDGCLGLSADEKKYYLGFVSAKDALEKLTSLKESDSFKNPESRAVNYWLHFWGAMAVSKFKDFMPIVLTAKAGA